MARKQKKEKVVDTSAFLTVEELAARLRIGRATAWKYVSAGLVPSCHIGRRRLVPAAAAAEIVERVRREGLPSRHQLAAASSDLPPAA